MSQKPLLHTLSTTLGLTDTAPDGELLQRFAEVGDQTAFELVVRRHADLVWGVCRAVLPGDTHTAEDAFQATFLALARRADSIRDGSAAGWLFRVARNAAVRARTRATRRRVSALPDALACTGAPVEEEAARQEVAPVVAEEVDRLGATLRDPIVLCFFEGHTHAEAANRLGWPIGTVASRLARAKDVLRDRLTRRGVALPAAGLTAVFASTSAPASPLVRSTLAIATGPANQISPAVLSLTHGVLSAMRFTQLKATAALVFVALGLSVTLAAVSRNTTEPAMGGSAPLAARSAAPVPKDKPTAKELEARELKALKGEWRVVKLETDRKNERELAGLRFAFTDNHLAIRSANEDENENFTVGLVPTESPRHVDLTIENPEKGERDAGKVARGIYELKGDTLTLCVRHFAADDANRPTAFKSGEGLVLTVLERVKDEKEELKALAGEWRAVKVIALGQEVGADELAKRKMMWFFDGAEMLMTGEGEKGDKATIKLDPSAAPATIDLSGKDDKGTESKLPGIYFRQGDRLTVCYAHQALPPPQNMGKDPVRPTELKAGDGVVFIVFERAPKK
ncbi:sigma-70 family RNA polymerase sigma factor [Gemmata sp. G18]|uniref:Sigma-70 family RNA polymerase sigma factor n=1 Tax=Gemmata palustris TaxID=2822762 RepID=A0ABS5BZ53_9BACT|nr:sigma-70 family RNA polymerase sigma factor [Gemmata palustris]MBP3958923.1 sigma-70 family RNA polymerase sigma factor [Gemmata palustris]